MSKKPPFPTPQTGDGSALKKAIRAELNELAAEFGEREVREAVFRKTKWLLEIKPPGRATATITIHAQGTVTEAPAPEASPVPRFAERLLGYVLEADQLEEKVGDLEEKFRRQAAKHGVGYARRVYCRWVASVVASSLTKLVTRGAARIALLRMLLEKAGLL